MWWIFLFLLFHLYFQSWFFSIRYYMCWIHVTLYPCMLLGRDKLHSASFISNSNKLNHFFFQVSLWVSNSCHIITHTYLHLVKVCKGMSEMSQKFWEKFLGQKIHPSHSISFPLFMEVIIIIHNGFKFLRVVVKKKYKCMYVLIGPKLRKSKYMCSRYLLMQR